MASGYFPECQLFAVHLPERFRGGYAFGAATGRIPPDSVSPAKINSILLVAFGRALVNEVPDHSRRTELRAAERPRPQPPRPASPSVSSVRHHSDTIPITAHGCAIYTCLIWLQLARVHLNIGP